MPQVTITVTAELEELPQALEQLLYGFAAAPVAQVRGTAPERQEADGIVDEVIWPSGDLARWWRRITPDAREVVAEIAKRPDGYPFNEVFKVLDLSGTTVGGRMSSLGHAKRDFPGRPDIVIPDYRRRQYSIHPEIAAEIRRLAEGQSS